MTPKEKLDLISLPYLRTCEICQLMERSRTTVCKMTKKTGLENTPFGFLTDDIIKAFKLQGAIKRWKEVAK